MSFLMTVYIFLEVTRRPAQLARVDHLLLLREIPKLDYAILPLVKVMLSLRQSITKLICKDMLQLKRNLGQIIL